MKKMILIITVIFLAIFLFACVNFIFIEERPEQVFLKNVAKLEDGDIVELKELATFDWDIMYVIMPYSDAQWVNEKHSLNIYSQPDFPYVDLLFIKNDKLVAEISSARYRKIFYIYLHIEPLFYNYSEDYYFSATRDSQESPVWLYRD